MSIMPQQLKSWGGSPTAMVPEMANAVFERLQANLTALPGQNSQLVCS